MIVRPALISDASAICEIWNPLIEKTATTFNTQLKVPDQLAAEITERAGAFFVAEHDEQLIGFSTYFPFRSGPGYRYTREHSINLSPQANGKGVGRALMERLQTHAKENDIHSLWAGISSENPSGVAFHEKIGFAHIARLPEVGFKFGRWMDLVLMQKILK